MGTVAGVTEVMAGAAAVVGGVLGAPGDVVEAGAVIEPPPQPPTRLANDMTNTAKPPINQERRKRILPSKQGPGIGGARQRVEVLPAEIKGKEPFYKLIIMDYYGNAMNII